VRNGIPPEHDSLQHRAPELNYAVEDFCAFSSTMIFSPVTSVMTVSGDCSTNLIRSELTVSGMVIKAGELDHDWLLDADAALF